MELSPDRAVTVIKHRDRQTKHTPVDPGAKTHIQPFHPLSTDFFSPYMIFFSIMVDEYKNHCCFVWIVHCLRMHVCMCVCVHIKKTEERSE